MPVFSTSNATLEVLSVVACSLSLFSSQVLAASPAAIHPQVNLNLHVTLADQPLTGKVAGDMTIQNWHPAGNRFCFYLPYNDPQSGQDPIKSTDVIPHKYSNVTAKPGHIAMTTDVGSLKRYSDHLIEYEGPTGPIRIHFESHPPRWLDSDASEWMFHDFYPQILADCPSTSADISQVTTIPEVLFDVSLNRPDGWNMTTSAALVDKGDGPTTHWFMDAKAFAFALNQHMTTFQDHWNGLQIDWVSHSDDFLKFKPALYNALAAHTKLFGPFPFPKLVVLETSELQKASIPGIITINRPKQAGLAKLQDDSTNWTDWQVTTFSADQWAGAGLNVSSWDELWLIRGLIEFATFEALRGQPTLFGLMKAPVRPAEEADMKQLNFDYRQSQDLLAAVLTYMQPYHALTDQDFHNLDPSAKQYGLNYIRSALALRQINYSLSPVLFQSVLREFYKEFHGQILTSENFAQFLAEKNTILTPEQKHQAGASLREWWSTSDWPDFVLGDIDETKVSDQSYKTTVHLKQREGYSIPVAVRVVDGNGTSYIKEAEQNKDNPLEWQAHFELSAPHDVVEVEPTRQIFDWNRFNNKNKWPDVRFFPGNLKTFADDAYSVIWLPLASKLPGDDFTWLFVAQVFRYVQASMTAVASYVPNTRRYGYSLYYLTDIPKFGAYTIFDVIQDRGRAYSGERVADAGIYRTFRLLKNPVIEYGFRLRHREAMNQAAETGHETIAFKAQAVPINQLGACNYFARTELEQLVQTRNKEGGPYHRNSGMIEGSCKALDWLEAGVRGFAGVLDRDTTLSSNLDFNPQEVTEARMRIDDPQLPDVREISTLGLDLLTPMPLPLPSALFTVNRQMRFRMFYDYGQSKRPANHYKDAGIGLWIPFGGDLVGKGSVQILNLSVLAVLYRETDEVKSFKPGIVFDFDFFGKI